MTSTYNYNCHKIIANAASVKAIGQWGRSPDRQLSIISDLSPKRNLSLLSNNIFLIQVDGGGAAAYVVGQHTDSIEGVEFEIL